MSTGLKELILKIKLLINSTDRTDLGAPGHLMHKDDKKKTLMARWRSKSHIKIREIERSRNESSRRKGSKQESSGGAGEKRGREKRKPFSNWEGYSNLRVLS